MDLSYHDVSGIIAGACVLIANIPYLYAIIKRKISPHAFSSLIWGAVMLVAFAAQLYDNAGAGAWVLLLMAITELSIGYAAFLIQQRNTITKSDIISLFLTLSAIPLWVITETPLYSVILVSLIDAAGYFPSFRKGYLLPREDSVYPFKIGILSNIFLILAVEHYSLITLTYPLTIITMNTSYVLYLYLRRKVTD